MYTYIPNTDEDRKQMLKEIGVSSIDDLFSCIPEKSRMKKELDIPGPTSEIELRRKMKKLSDKNIHDYPSFLGAGYYNHYIPSVVDQMLSRSEFYTAYTPYQAEISQGMLQAIFEYQTVMCDLTDMDVSNASVYDGATAAAESAIMASMITHRNKILVSKTVHPETRRVLHTYCEARNIEVQEIDLSGGQTDIEKLKSMLNSEVAGVIIQNPNFLGSLEEIDDIEKYVHKNGSIYILDVYPISLGILKSPGEAGADIAIGEGQSLGNHMCFGGPGFGFITTREKYLRKLPGRIVGQTADRQGNRAYVLTLQAREQHIRRENASSNICSNQALNTLAALIYLTLMGKKGIKQAAELCYKKSHYAYSKISSLKGYKTVFNGPFFNEFVIDSYADPEKMNDQLLDNGLIGGYPIGEYYPEYKNSILYCVTEMNSKEEIDKLVECLEVIK